MKQSSWVYVPVRNRLFILLFVAAGMGCDQRSSLWKTYEEIAVSPSVTAEAPHEHQPRSSVALRATDLAWTTPSGWTEEAGSGMRLSTFTVLRGGETGLCTMVVLKGVAGGLEANVRRWMGQLKIAEPASEDWQAFLGRSQTLEAGGGLSGRLVDLTLFGNGDSSSASMLVTMFELNQSTLFIKFSGPRSLILSERDNFNSLCLSLRPKS